MLTLKEFPASILIAAHVVMGRESAGMEFLTRNSLVSKACGSLSEADNADG